MKTCDQPLIYQCPQVEKAGSLAAAVYWVTYLLLAAGIWIAFLWLLYSSPVVRSVPSQPLVVGTLRGMASPPRPLHRVVEKSDKEPEQQDDGPLPLSLVAQDVRFASVPAADPRSIGTVGYIERKALILGIQRSLTRAGCYRGAMTGLWASDTKEALSAFLVAANARLPIQQPDDILLHLVNGADHATCTAHRRADPVQAAPAPTISRRVSSPGLMGLGAPQSSMNAIPSRAGAKEEYRTLKARALRRLRRGDVADRSMVKPHRLPASVGASNQILKNLLAVF